MNSAVSHFSNFCLHFFFGKTKEFDYEGLFRIQYGFFSEERVDLF